MKSILLILFLLVQSVAAQEPTDAARVLYDQGKYQESLDLLLKDGLRTGTDFYNAANNYYRLGKKGLSYAYFQKAKSLLPFSDDVNFNLKLVESDLQKSSGLIQDQSAWRGKFVPYCKYHSTGLPFLIVGLFTFLLGLIFYWARKRKENPTQTLKSAAFIVVFLLWILGIGCATAFFIAKKTPLAVVTAEQLVARSGPAESFAELFKLAAGSRVEMTGNSRDGWAQVRFSLGNLGWIMEKDLLEL